MANNIVLIGMPGCGKTTIAEALAKTTGLNWIDLDEYLTHYYRMSIPEMFRLGENYFRQKESEICYALKDLSDTIISCGGGVVLRPINMTYLKEKGTVFWLERDLYRIMQDVEVEGRPLLAKGKGQLYMLYQARAKLYAKYADWRIDNNGTIDQTVEMILTKTASGHDNRPFYGF